MVCESPDTCPKLDLVGVGVRVGVSRPASLVGLGVVVVIGRMPGKRPEKRLLRPAVKRWLVRRRMMIIIIANRATMTLVDIEDPIISNSGIFVKLGEHKDNKT